MSKKKWIKILLTFLTVLLYIFKIPTGCITPMYGSPSHELIDNDMTTDVTGDS